VKKLIQLMADHKGQISTIQARRPLRKDELCRGNKDRQIFKVSVHNVSFGVEYDVKKAVKEARANGELPAENQGRKGKEWVEYPFVLRSLKTDKCAIVVYPAANGSKSHYEENGEEITRDAYEAATTPSSRTFYGSKERRTFEIGLDHIESIKIGGVTYRMENGDIVKA
jgi:hypothetical protein